MEHDNPESLPTIAFLGRGLVNWTGGCDYLRLCIAGLSTADPSVRLNVVLPESTMHSRTRMRLGAAKRGILHLLQSGRFDLARSAAPTLDEVRSALKIEGTVCDVVPYRNSRKGLLHALKGLGAQAVFPALESLGTEFPVPWVGYIPDFQHRYLPDFFSRRECSLRDRIFGTLIDDARVLSLNSRAVANDVRRFYPQAICKLVVLPFAPVPAAEWLESEDGGIVLSYQLPRRYFLISNQFWIHKSHITAFEALKILHSKLKLRDVELICTGSTYDYRWPQHFENLRQKVDALGLSSKIRFLGMVPKLAQIAIMKQAVAVVQPTLFEGGPGGGSVYDAVAVGTRVIASDIPVNREIIHKTVSFFPAQSAEALAEEMQHSLDTPYQRPEISVLKQQGRVALENFGAKIVEAIALSR